jgi:drug/metabolite transporter (DMT)-like permease
LKLNRRFSKQSLSRLTRGYLICIIGTIFWSSTAVFIRYLTQTYHLPPLVLAFWRDLILALFLGTVFAFARPALLRVGRQHWPFILLYGLVLSLFNSTWTISVALNGAAVSTVLAYSSAAFTAIMGWRLFGEQLGKMKILAVTLSLLGCVLVSGAYDLAAWQVNPIGIATGLVSGLAFAVYSLMGKESAHRSLNSWTVLLYTFAAAAGFLLLYNLFGAWLPAGLSSTNLFWLGWQPVGWLVLIALAIGPTVAGYGLYTASLVYLPASVANVIATLEPVMTGLQAYILLGERFTLAQWIGSGLILGGVVVLRIGEGMRSEESAPATPGAAAGDSPPPGSSPSALPQDARG